MTCKNKLKISITIIIEIKEISVGLTQVKDLDFWIRCSVEGNLDNNSDKTYKLIFVIGIEKEDTRDCYM